jgi:hypothetical protein
MGTKKGGARKGQPKGARLGYDDVPKSKKKWTQSGRKRNLGWKKKFSKILKRL